jgi:hypothetical protein
MTASPATPRLSVIIVTYNSRADLDGCLGSLTRSAPDIQLEIAIVDNASSDGTAQYVRERWPGVRVLDAGGNLGFARANNLGIRATGGGLVLLLNPDTVVPPGAIDRLVAALEARPEAAIAGPRIVDRDGAGELSFGAMISPWAELRQKVLGRAYERQAAWAVRRVNRAASAERFVDWVSGAALLVYRADAEAAGLLDERYFLYTEDVDFCAAIRARGRRVLFTPAATITHLRGRSRATVPGAMNAAYRRSHLAFYEKHHPFWAPLLRVYLRSRGQLPDQRE